MQGLVDDGVIADAVHDAIWDVCQALKVECPEHLLNDAVQSAVHRIQGEMDSRGQMDAQAREYNKYK